MNASFLIRDLELVIFLLAQDQSHKLSNDGGERVYLGGKLVNFYVF